MTTFVDTDQAFLEAVGRIADEVAAVHADAVDRDARFPQETIDALKDARALSAYVPQELGGDGVSIEALAKGCELLGRRCGASAMVFAMHQIQVATLVRHLDEGFFTDYLRELSADIREGVVLGPDGALLAGPDNLADAARDLFNAAKDAREAALDAEADRLGLDWPRLARDMDDPAIRQRLDRNVALARKLAGGATLGLGMTKRLIQEAQDNDFDTHLDRERDLQRQAGESADYAEGVAAFLDKRPPVFNRG